MSGWIDPKGWIHCPTCGNKTRTKVNPDTVLKHFPLFCPKCGKEVVLKKTKKGRKYYGCEDNPECDFMSWQKPSNKKCPVCGNYMVEKGNKLLCSQETCGYVEQMEKEEK